MAEHNIKMTIPAIDVTRVDVIFQVKCDGSVLGELRLSKGDLRWYPKNAQRAKKKTWEQFAEWMSS